MKKTDLETLNVRVQWGNVWINTIGRKIQGKQGYEAQVYDPHAKEMCWTHFSGLDSIPGHSNCAWTLTPEKDYKRPGFLMVRQANSALRFSLYRTDENGQIIGKCLCIGDRQECDSKAQ